MTGEFSLSIGYSPTTVSYVIQPDHTVIVTFKYMGTDYKFNIQKWEIGRALHNLTDLSDISEEDLRSMIVRALKDCFQYLDKLTRTQLGRVKDYSLWYKQKYYDKLNTYTECIQMLTCNCVIEGDFLSSASHWEIVPY
jgi:hypothetical protein